MTKPLAPHLGANWCREASGTPKALFLQLASTGGDVAWLEDAVDGTHVIAAGGQRVSFDALADLTFDERLSFGWIDYELGLHELGVSRDGPRSTAGESRWMRVDQWIVVQGERVQLQSTGKPWSLPTPQPSPSATGTPGSSVAATPRESDESYAAKIRECQRWITEGDSYLACLTTGYTAKGVDPIASYLALRELSPSHRGGFLRIDGKSIASISPERFISLDGGTVRTRPIKGTRKRHSEPSRDAALAHELVTSEKERAENVMIVDLCRNDLHLVCEPGTVSVPQLLQVESYSAVHQLVSTIEGRLKPGFGTREVIRALFPAGSMVGTPKARTASLLRELEGCERGTYSGCFGVARQDFAQLTMTIRALVEEGGRASIGVGGGITALSNVAEEVAEVRLKADPIVRSLRPAR